MPFNIGEASLSVVEINAPKLWENVMLLLLTTTDLHDIDAVIAGTDKIVDRYVARFKEYSLPVVDQPVENENQELRVKCDQLERALENRTTQGYDFGETPIK